jgi:hypothetical protein
MFRRQRAQSDDTEESSRTKRGTSTASAAVKNAGRRFSALFFGRSGGSSRSFQSSQGDSEPTLTKPKSAAGSSDEARAELAAFMETLCGEGLGDDRDLRASSMSQIMEGSYKDLTTLSASAKTLSAAPIVGGPARLPETMDEATILELITTFTRRRLPPCAPIRRVTPSANARRVRACGRAPPAVAARRQAASRRPAHRSSRDRSSVTRS